LDWLIDGGLRVLVTDGATPLSDRTGWSLSFVRWRSSVNFPVGAHNIDHDRRLAKPAIMKTIEGVRSGCAWRWSRSDTMALHVGALQPL
jgi:hypothetical protein